MDLYIPTVAADARISPAPVVPAPAAGVCGQQTTRLLLPGLAAVCTCCWLLCPGRLCCWACLLLLQCCVGEDGGIHEAGRA